MNKASDVIVIGAGVVGCAAAYYLAKRGVKVTVLERREVACGASGRNGSGARQSGRDNRELPLAMFGVKHIWPTLGEELGEDIEYIQNGNMRLGKTEKDREALEELVRQNSSLGLDVRMVYGQDIRELIPDVSPEVQYATYIVPQTVMQTRCAPPLLCISGQGNWAHSLSPISRSSSWKRWLEGSAGYIQTTGSMRQTASSCVRDLAPERSCAPWGWMSLCCLS